MKKLLGFATLAFLSNMPCAVADPAVGLYEGRDASGKPCQVQVTFYTSEVDPQVSENKYDEALYSQTKNTIQFKTSFTEDQQFTAESPLVEGANQYSRYSLIGPSDIARYKTAQSNFTKPADDDIIVKLNWDPENLGGESIQRIQVPAEIPIPAMAKKVVGRHALTKVCDNLVFKSSNPNLRAVQVPQSGK